MLSRRGLPGAHRHREPPRRSAREANLDAEAAPATVGSRIRLFLRRAARARPCCSAARRTNPIGLSVRHQARPNCPDRTRRPIAIDRAPLLVRRRQRAPREPVHAIQRNAFAHGRPRAARPAHRPEQVGGKDRMRSCRAAIFRGLSSRQRDGVSARRRITTGSRNVQWTSALPAQRLGSRCGRITAMPDGMVYNFAERQLAQEIRS